MHTYNIICLSETWIVTMTNFQIPKYKLIRVDNSWIQGGNICICHKNFVPIKANNASCLKEFSNYNLSVHGEQSNITLFWRSPSQSSEEFHALLTNFKFLLDYIINQNQNWCSGDKITYEGKKIHSLVSQCVFKQVISDPTHILESNSSCIYLILRNKVQLWTQTFTFHYIRIVIIKQCMGNVMIHFHINDLPGTIKMEIIN